MFDAWRSRSAVRSIDLRFDLLGESCVSLGSPLGGGGSGCVRLLSRRIGLRTGDLRRRLRRGLRRDLHDVDLGLSSADSWAPVCCLLSGPQACRIVWHETNPRSLTETIVVFAAIIDYVPCPELLKAPRRTSRRPHAPTLERRRVGRQLTPNNFRPSVELTGSGRNIKSPSSLHTTEGSFESAVSTGARTPPRARPTTSSSGRTPTTGTSPSSCESNDVAFHVSSSRRTPDRELRSHRAGRCSDPPVWWRDASYATWRQRPRSEGPGRANLQHLHCIGVCARREQFRDDPQHDDQRRKAVAVAGRAARTLLCGQLRDRSASQLDSGPLRTEQGQRRDPGAGFPWREILDEVQNGVNPAATLSIGSGFWAFTRNCPPEPEEPAAFDEYELASRTRASPDPITSKVSRPSPGQTRNRQSRDHPSRDIGASRASRQLNPLVVDDSLRIRFSITHSFEENRVALVDRDLQHGRGRLRQRVIERGTHFSLSAGYNEVGLLCEGVIQAVKISREGTERDHAADRHRATSPAPSSAAWMSANWPQGNPCDNDHGRSRPAHGLHAGRPPTTFPRSRGRRLVKSYSAHKPAKAVLEEILERYELVASYFCGQVVVDQASPIVRPSTLPRLEQGHRLTERERAEFERVFIQQDGGSDRGSP